MRNQLKITTSSDVSYGDDNENLHELNKPISKKPKDMVAMKSRVAMNRNRHEFGISPVSLSSSNSTERSEYETITSILAAAAHMGEGDNSSRDESSAQSPSFTDDLSYASLKQRILKNRTAPMIEQSLYANELFHPVHGQMKSRQDSSTAPNNMPLSSTRPMVPTPRPEATRVNLSVTTQQKALNIIHDPSPSALTAESIITSWSVDAISPKNYQPRDDREDCASDRLVESSHIMSLLLDDESSKDFELDLCSQGTYDYDSAKMQEMRYPTIVEVNQGVQSAQHTVNTPTNSNSPEDEILHSKVPSLSSRPPLIKSSQTRTKSPAHEQAALSNETQHSVSKKQSSSSMDQNLDKNQCFTDHADVSISTWKTSNTETKSVLRTKNDLQPSFHVENQKQNQENLDVEKNNTCFSLAAASSTITVSQLRRLLYSQGDLAAHKKDENGRYPLHTLSSNYNLILPILQASQVSQQHSDDKHQLTLNMNRMISMTDTPSSKIIELEQLVVDLVLLNPKALITLDCNGRMPFTESIYQWIELCNERFYAQDDSFHITEISGSQLSDKYKNNRPDIEHGFSTFLDTPREKIDAKQYDMTPSASSPSTTSFFNKVSGNLLSNRFYKSIMTPRKSLHPHKVTPLSLQRSQETDSDARSDAACSPGTNDSVAPVEHIDRSKHNFDMVFHVEWSLKMLNRIISLIAELKFDFDKDEDLRNLLLPYPCNMSGFRDKFVFSLVSSNPTLLKILILKSDIFVNSKVFDRFQIFDAIMKSNESVGEWIVYLLEAFDRDIVSRAVDYLQCFSNICEDQVTKRKNDSNIMGLFRKISNFNFLLPAILSIEQKEDLQRSVSTKVIQFSMDQEMHHWFSVMIVLLDFSFRALLIISFQLLCDRYIMHHTNQPSYHVSFYLVLLSALYGLFRLLSRMISTAKVSLSTYKKNIGGFYDWNERISLPLAVIGAVWIDIVKNNESVPNSLKYFISLTTLVLWTRLFTWFYVINNTATLFFRAVGKMIWDLRWLWFSLISVLLAFSQVFFVTLSSSKACLAHETDCNLLPDAYLQGYSILLGVFEVSKFTTPFSKFIFVSFTVIVSFLLFNVLIGLVVHSISGTMKEAHIVCFNISRLSYVTDVRAFRRLFTMKWTLVKAISLGLFVTCVTFLMFASSSSTRLLIVKTFDTGIFLAGMIALMLIGLLSCFVFLAQVSFIETPDDEFKENVFAQRLIYPFRILAFCLMNAYPDAESFLCKRVGKCSEQIQNSDAPTLEKLQYEMRQMNQYSHEKLDKILEMLTKK